MSRLTFALALALLALEACVAIWIVSTSPQTGVDSFGPAIPAGVVFVLSGLVALARRPESMTGVYLAAIGYLWLLVALGESSEPWIFSIGFLVSGLVWVPFGALVLSYPTGRLETRLERAIPLAAGVLLLGTALVRLLVDETPAPERCEDCPESAIAVADLPGLATAARIVGAIGSVVLIGIVIGLFLQRWRAATPALRRVLAPVLGAATVTLVAAGAFVLADQVSEEAGEDLLLVLYVVFTTVPLAFLYGVLRMRLARSSIAEVVTAIERGTPLRDALAEALRDPSLELAYRLDPARGLDGGWVDPLGQSVPEPHPGPTRAVRFITRGGERIAALTYDASLQNEPELVEAVTAAAGLGLANERLQAALRAEVRLTGALADTAPALLSIVDTDGRFIKLNPATLRASGYERDEEVQGRFFWEIFIDEPEREEMRARFHEAAPEFPPAEYENTFTNVRGERLVIYWRAAPVHDEAGRVVSIVAGGLDLTERKRREEEIRAGQERLAAVVESAPLAIIEVDLEDRILQWNPAATRMFGWSAEEVLGKSIPIIPPDRTGEYRSLLGGAHAHGGVTGYETTRVRKDGTHVDVEISNAPIRDATGRVVGVMAVFADVTERRRLALAKEQEREFLDAIANNTPSLLCFVDDTGRVTKSGANTAFERALGYTPDELGGQLFWEQFVAPEDADEVRSILERVAAGEDLGEHDHHWVTSSGRRLLIAWTCTALPKLDERRLFLISGVDVTERQERETQVERQRDLLNAITEAVPSFLIAVDENGVVVEHSNRAFLEAFGWTDGEIVGKSFLGLVAREDDHAARMAIANAANGLPQPEHESVWQGRTGNERIVAWTARPVLDPSGRQLVLVSGTDVTVRRRQEEEIRASRARLVAAEDDARRKLERNLHDGAQQRLVALSVALRLAESKLDRDPEGAVQLLAGARDELGHALEELRELARGIHPAVLTARGLGPALESLVSRMTIPVELRHPDERLAPPVEAAAYYVVSESLANVTKYAQAATAAVEITRDDGRVLVTVTDDGVGGADPLAGSGLRGLADRVAALDGVLVVESPNGGGTRVRAEIPLPTEGEA